MSLVHTRIKARKLDTVVQTNKANNSPSIYNNFNVLKIKTSDWDNYLMTKQECQASYTKDGLICEHFLILINKDALVQWKTSNYSTIDNFHLDPRQN